MSIDPINQQDAYLQESEINQSKISLNFSSNSETTLDILGCFPFISILSGGLRALWGTCDLVSSIAKAPFTLIKDLFSFNIKNPFAETIDNTKEIAKRAFDAAQGAIETIPYAGNLVSICINLYKK